MCLQHIYVLPTHKCIGNTYMCWQHIYVLPTQMSCQHIYALPTHQYKCFGRSWERSELYQRYQRYRLYRLLDLLVALGPIFTDIYGHYRRLVENYDIWVEVWSTITILGRSLSNIGPEFDEFDGI